MTAEAQTTPVTSTSGEPASLPELRRAILQTVAYVDMYSYPLTAAEIHRYLVSVAASPEEVAHALGHAQWAGRHLEERDGYYALAGRGFIVDIRRRRAEAARHMWPGALYYARLTAALPFARMVAVTGSLAVNNADPDSDIDFLIVTAPGRLWLCRAMAIVIVRYAARRGVPLCPNYFLSERALAFSEQNLYTAHELIQMVPVAGQAVYERMLDQNRWVSRFLPNAGRGPAGRARELSIPKPVAGLRRLGEAALRTPPGSWLERWEMERKVRRFSRQATDESAFSADWCKGHFEDHGHQAMEAFADHWQAIAQDAPSDEE